MEKPADIAIVHLLENLLQLIDENRRLISDNYEEIGFLRADLWLLKTFMAKYTAEHSTSKPEIDMADEIRSLVFEVEDLVETYIVEETLFQKEGLLKKAVGAMEHLNNLRAIGRTVQQLCVKVRKTYEDNKEIVLHPLAPEELPRHDSISVENQFRRTKKLVLKLDVHDNKDKQKAMKTVCGQSGVESVSFDMKKQQFVVVGDLDPVSIASKLRKSWHTEIVSVGPAKELGEKKEGAKKDNDKKWGGVMALMIFEKFVRWGVVMATMISEKFLRSNKSYNPASSSLTPGIREKREDPKKEIEKKHEEKEDNDRTLRKPRHPEMATMGLEKELGKKKEQMKEEDKEEEGKKDNNKKKSESEQIAEHLEPYQSYNPVPIGDNQDGVRIIGFDDAVDEVLKLLGGRKLVHDTFGVDEGTSEAKQGSKSKELEVVSIHGMPGLGKTTLARKVLNDLRIEYHFSTRIFVNVSNDYNKKEVLLSILGVLIKNIREHDNSVEELVEMVKDNLKYRYLIVMDDVWTNEVWEDIKKVLPDNNKGSRVLVTTRIESVANYVATKTEPYRLRLMHPEEAEELLRTKVFNENKCLKGLESIEEKILEKCDRLPLAIVLTAGILRSHPGDPKWWEDVLLHVAQLADDDCQKRSDGLIRLSYGNLRDMLKLCFLYLGVFPVNLEIPVSKLFQLWIAEGFIPQYEEASMEKIAELYLSELVGRNLVMVQQRTLSGRIKTCRIHDKPRDFCMKMAKAENVFQQIRKETGSSSSRRLSCINSYFQEYICQQQPAEKVRSFLSFGEETTLRKDLCSDICKHFKLLRVLYIISVKIPGHFPTQLPNLVLLKFIAISCDLNILPKKMSNLVNLQTLIVHTTKPTLKIEADIWGMTKLWQLHTNTSTFLPECPRQSPGSENLQTLANVAPESLVNDVFQRTKKLKKLGIRGNLGTLVKANGESPLFDSLCELTSLENLKLSNDAVAAKLPSLPPAHKFPARLTRLSLQDTSLDWQIHMPILEKLQFLEVLKLKDNAFMGKHWQTEGGGFRSLKILYIGATDLKNWEAKDHDFPELRCLILKYCKELLRIPPDFVYIKSLEMINLEQTADSVVSSARRIVQTQLLMLIEEKDFETRPVILNLSADLMY